MKKEINIKTRTRHVGIKIETGTAEDFFKRSLERARKMDRGERPPAEVRLTFEDPADLMRVAFSVQRIRVLLTVRSQPRPVSELAHVLKRDRKAVSRDVKVLESFGLVRLHEQPNPGHGLMKVVEPLAAKYREFSAGVRKSEAIAHSHPIMPVSNGFGCGFIGSDGDQLR